MKKIVFLDLEETIIKSWHDPVLINVEKIRSFLKEHNTTKIHIFSFAIDNGMDKLKFNHSGLKKEIEDRLDVEIVATPSVQEIMKVCVSHTGNVFEMYEFKALWGKMRAFHDFINACFVGCECWLLDDVVQNTTLINRDTNTTIHTVKI